MKNVILMNVDELWLKGRNRGQYAKLLKKHIRKSCRLFLENYSLKNENQRIVLRTEETIGESFFDELKRIPGIYSLQRAREASLDEEEIKKVCLEEFEFCLSKNPDIKTFKVETKRVNKTFPKGSMEFSRELGSVILKKYGHFLSAKMKNNDCDIQVKINQQNAFITSHKELGIGGLPVSSSGYGLTMLSGGFDSPVASYKMITRGMHQTFVFFHAYPFVGDEVKEKIVTLAKKIASYQQGGLLLVFPFGELQKLISKKCREDYRTMLFRWAMMKACRHVAEFVNTSAIITGDSLGQVSSQTLENMSLMDKASDQIILRPLIGSSKREIIEIAEKIGTHDISIIPHDDACSLFAPKNPVIRPHLGYWAEITSELEEEVNQLCVNLLQSSERISLSNIPKS
tara:strand:+ start:119959 stop:121158 length:1200 start_codon:yes stop_codon:yes gene_type:complete